MNLRDQFKLRVHQSNGNQYEELFNSIMKVANNNFQSVKPHGNIGDRGNDGWVQVTGEYYQVYAPEELSKNTKESIKKVKNDFEVLKGYWEEISPIKSFYYVLNDKFSGISPHITKVLEEIKTENNLESTGVFSASDLERLLFRLPQDSICSILGVDSIQTDQLFEDRYRARNFLDEMGFIFEELFQSGSEAGYFFPSNVFYFVSNTASNDWQLNRMFCNNSDIKYHQQNMWSLLIQMHNQVSQDSHYEDIGRSFKYRPPYDLPDRDQRIESKRSSMGILIESFAKSYEIVRNYSA